MIAIFRKEIAHFFATLTGYLTIGVFLLLVGLMMWVFPDYSILNNQYATLDQLFSLAPVIFLFLVPAITMRSFAEEKQSGNLELLLTKPLRDSDLLLGKSLACIALLIIALLPTLVYYYSLYQLGSPVGNLDSGQVLGSYIGLVFLGAAFVSIGIFASSLTQNQIAAFILAVFLCFFFYYAFFFLSKLPVFFGQYDDYIQRLGIDYHYESMSRGVIDTRDLIYFVSVFLFFYLLSLIVMARRNF